MQNFHRAIIIRRQILNHADDDWGFIYHDGIMRLSTGGDDWHAIIWTSSFELPDTTETVVEGRSFLECYRTQLCTHTLDVWCDRLGKVLSFRSNGMASRLITFKRGEWENLFGLRPPGHRKSPELKSYANKSTDGA